MQCDTHRQAYAYYFHIFQMYVFRTASQHEFEQCQGSALRLTHDSGLNFACVAAIKDEGFLVVDGQFLLMCLTQKVGYPLVNQQFAIEDDHL